MKNDATTYEQKVMPQTTTASRIGNGIVAVVTARPRPPPSLACRSIMEAAYRQPHSPSQRPKASSNGNHPPSSSKDDAKINDKTSLTAAADLIRTLDSAFAEMSSLSTSAARDAEDARRNAREASEVARRYTARSYAGHPDTSLYYDMKANGKDSSQDDKDPGDAVNGEGSGTMAAMRKRKMSNKIQSSSERLARSHAEDVLSLSLELERTKQALENERMAHDGTRSGLTEARAKNTQLDTQIQKFLTDMETQREDHGRQLDGLQQELSRAHVRVEAAEEDAQLALDLAKGNAESREQLETWLQRALQEVEVLRGQLNRVGLYQGELPPDQLVESPKRKAVVRFAESPTIVEEHPQDNAEIATSPKSQASRSMVAAGRHLLHRASAGPEGQKMHIISLPQSTECREKLRQRLRSFGDGVDIATPAIIRRASVHGAHSIDMVMATKAIETCHKVTHLLRESGQRIGLAGQWWRAARKTSDDDDVETMTKQFCNTVEAKLEKRNNDLKEMQSLCEYLEGKLAISEQTPTVSRIPNG